jgi:Cu(I)/Ag(I) efflux system membrane fusion protein
VAVQLPAQQISTLGLQFEPVAEHTIDDPIRAVATVVVDESSITHIHTRVAGWLEKLYVNSNGQPVRAGEPLAAVFSQELYSSQEEFLTAVKRARDGQSSAMLSAARARLQTLGMRDAEINEVERSGKSRRLVTITAPINGIVINRAVSAGTAIDPATELMTIADLSRIWIVAEVNAGDAALVRTGATARVNFPTSRREPLTAKVDYIYPMLSEKTRTVRVRLAVPNGNGALRPGLYGEVSFPTVPRQALTVARDSIIDTGKAQHVFVHTADDVLQPREVSLGARIGDRVEILGGLTAGEHVVTTGVFLVDSESRLRASSGASIHAGHGQTTRTADERAPSPATHSH